MIVSWQMYTCVCNKLQITPKRIISLKLINTVKHIQFHAHCIAILLEYYRQPVQAPKQWRGAGSGETAGPLDSRHARAAG